MDGCTVVRLGVSFGALLPFHDSVTEAGEQPRLNPEDSSRDSSIIHTFPEPASQSRFTIVVLPDTQYYALFGSSTFAAQTEWIVQERENRNIVFVTQLGDCVQNGDQRREWRVADNAFRLLEDSVTTGLVHGIPFAVAVGNHDQDPRGQAEGDTTTLYNEYFGISRFLGRPYYGGHYGSKNDNHYQLFDVGRLRFIVIHLEYDPTPENDVLDWAAGLLETHASRRAIIISHYLLDFDNTFDSQGRVIYESLREYPNVFMMLCGHRPGEGRRTDSFNGRTIHTLRTDYSARPNQGNGWLRLIVFRPDDNEIRMRTFSPTLNRFETDANSDFVIDYDMSEECSTSQECQDGLFCNGQEQCVSGECVAGSPVNCADGVPCTTDECDENADACAHTPVDSLCDNGEYCDGAETCDLAAGCIAGAPACMDLLCDEVDDQCVECLIDRDCRDEDGCTRDDCLAHTCTHTTVLYGDLADTDGSCRPDGHISIHDIFAVLDAFSGASQPECPQWRVDIAGDNQPCRPDGHIGLPDIFAVLDAYQGTTVCCK